MVNKVTYSIIIPHKNCPDLLKRCIDSIPIRDDIQIIVVDDNSDSDKKPIINREYVDVILLEQDQSKGAGRARNIGLKYAKGEWLLFSDADDYFAPGFIGLLDRYNNSELDVVYFGYLNQYPDGTITVPVFNRLLEQCDNPEEDVDKVRFMFYAPWNKMVNYRLVKEHNISFEEVPNGNDIFYSLQVGCLSRHIKMLDVPIYNYCYQNTGLVNKIQKSREEILCKLIHRVQTSELRAFLGYPNTKAPSLFYYLLITLKNSGAKMALKTLWTYLGNIRIIARNRMKFVDYFRLNYNKQNLLSFTVDHFSRNYPIDDK